MRKTLECTALVASILLLIGAQASAAVVPIFNTGESIGGASLPGGSLDPHFFVEETGQPAVALSDIFGAWAPNDATSAWIGWVDNPFPGNYGYYTFRTSFDLTGFDSSTASLSGDWAADNYGDMKLNGNVTGVSLPELSGDGHLNSFTISSGFQPGINTLEIAVFFEDGLDGLRLANLSLTAETPEPSSVVLAALGLIGLAALGWQRRGA